MRSIVVSLSEQRLRVLEDEQVIANFAVSTAKNGAGQQQGSECTPLGEHCIAAKIGDGEPLNRVFIARKPTNEIYSEALAKSNPKRDWILTRILWLRGLEPGFNQGGDVDSEQRYIYIHGTPASRPMGKPHSHGCITLHSGDMLKLFAMVEEGQSVKIE
jgi:lipoprotein-anchoring transpeptidase ErfK/SrfK